MIFEVVYAEGLKDAIAAINCEEAWVKANENYAGVTAIIPKGPKTCNARLVDKL